MTPDQRDRLLRLHQMAMTAWGEAKMGETTALWDASWNAEDEYRNFLDSIEVAA